MEPSSVSLPISVADPRCFVIEPAISVTQALTKAGARAEKSLGGLKSLFQKGKIETELYQRWLLPFWHVHCRSQFRYDRLGSYTIVASDGDVERILVKGTDQAGAEQALAYAVNQATKTGKVTLQGIEHCFTTRDVSELIDACDTPESGSLTDKAKALLQTEGKRFDAHMAQRNRSVSDLTSLRQGGLIDGRPLYEGQGDNPAVVLPPNQTAQRVLADVMKKVMVSIDPVEIYDWLVAADSVDLYFRPAYVFRFARRDAQDQVLDARLEQLDAVTGAWAGVDIEAVKSTNVPWDKVLSLTVDASAVVLTELGGPWLRVAAGLYKVGKDHFPGIVQDMKPKA